MTRLRVPVRLGPAVLLALAFPAALPVRPVGAREMTPMVVTTDTATYCSALSGRIGARGDLPPAICALRREGDALCARGEVRIGIRRLRRALVALDAEGDAADAIGTATEPCP